MLKGSCIFQGVKVGIDLVSLYSRMSLSILRRPPMKFICFLVDLCLRCCADVSGSCLAEKIPCDGKCSCCVG